MNEFPPPPPDKPKPVDPVKPDNQPLRDRPNVAFGPRPFGRAESQEVIITRRRRFPTSGHPFQMVFSGSDLTFGWAAVQAAQMTHDGGGPPVNTVLSYVELNTAVGSGKMVGNPYGDAPGSISPGAGLHGIWLKIAYTVVNGYSRIFNQVVDLGAKVAGGAEIIADGTHTVSSDYVALTATTTEYGYLFIGQVNGGVVTQQVMRSDIVLPAITLPATILSTDGGQSLGVGTDGGIFYDDP